jgi:peptidoglycan/xylan/chitin deacetylase (PgdA/CDA1 family)
MLVSAAAGVLAACGYPSSPDAAQLVTLPTQTPRRRGPDRKHAIQPTQPPLHQLPTREQLLARYGSVRPSHWGLDVAEVRTTLPTHDRVIALTFDACGGRGGSGFDERLIELLSRHSIAATLFINTRWVEANRSAFDRLAQDALFEIANHGIRHIPLSVTGRSAYGIAGTRSAGEVIDEVGGSQSRLTALLGHAPRFFRPGTAHYDDVAARIVTDLGLCPVDFDINADGGATFSPYQVTEAALRSRAGSILIAHMNHPGSGTANGIAAAVPRLQARGFRFAKLSI